jgi:hypothetical protein
MAGGTNFHRVILKSGPWSMSKKSAATPKAKPSKKGKSKPSLLYVSLDNADTVIEGGPPLRFVQRWGEMDSRTFLRGGAIPALR